MSDEQTKIEDAKPVSFEERHQSAIYWLVGVIIGGILGAILMLGYVGDLKRLHDAEMWKLHSQQDDRVAKIVEREVSALKFQAASRGFAYWALDHNGRPDFRWRKADDTEVKE